MRAPIVGAMLLSAITLAAQQQDRPPYAPPPYETPPPGNTQDQGPSQFPPDTRAPAPVPMTNMGIERQIQDKLVSEPALASADLQAKVDDRSVVLTGTASSKKQHEMALRMARSYADEREIVDRIEIELQPKI